VLLVNFDISEYPIYILKKFRLIDFEYISDVTS